MAFLKQNLKRILVAQQHRRYAKTVASKTMTYDKWIQEQEQKLKIEFPIQGKRKKSLTNDAQMRFFGRDAKEDEGNHSKNDWFCRKMEALFQKTDSEVLFFFLYEGTCSSFAYPMILHHFETNKNNVLIYGDEDMQEGNSRVNPWFKPDWSPDRFLSCFYFGGFLAVRTEKIKDAYFSCRERDAFLDVTDERELLYVLLAEMLERCGAFARGHDKAKLPVCHIPEVLYHSKENGYEQVKALKLPERKRPDEEGTLLSILIPSKDNPAVLFCCLDSLLSCTGRSVPYEVIVIDNGSSRENQSRIAARIESINQKKKQGFLGIRYLYRPMPFNFSAMCNLGASAAKGNLLLFLNDDMEIIQPDWLEKMTEKALLPYAGAVGAKLLYPDSHKIQHAGITNLRVGPAHKLQFSDDEKVHYFGINRGVHNMLAVTGACLMVRREVFARAGGFREELAVAFNDVDLCYTIYQQGYYNIVRNDVVLYHHESLSRGKDGESEEKQLRLLGEKDILYEKHQDLYGRDPFYHPYLTTDMLESEYTPACQYQVTLAMPWSEVREVSGRMQKVREDECLVVGMECAMDIYKWQYGVAPEKGKVKARPEDMGYYFQGYSFVIGSDNACYKKKLLLKNRENGQVWAISAEERYRQDIRNHLTDQLNVDLTGFAAKMRREDLPKGVYRFGMLAEDQCSRQKLVNWSSWVLEIS